MLLTLWMQTLSDDTAVGSDKNLGYRWGGEFKLLAPSSFQVITTTLHHKKPIMSEASSEWTFNFNFRLKEGQNYNERWSELIEVLKSFDFQKNLTPSSWFLHSLFPNDLEEIEGKVYKVLRKNPNHNQEDIAVIQMLERTESGVKSSVSVLDANKDYWERMNEEQFYYDFLRKLNEEGSVLPQC